MHAHSPRPAAAARKPNSREEDIDMAQVGARSVGAVGHDKAGRTRRRGMTPAQWYCLMAGAALLLAGIFGFLADGTFDTAKQAVDAEGGNHGGLQGDGFLGF